MNLTGRQIPFLHWLPDESFYSICSRQHIFLGNQSPEETLNFLFGASAKSFTHDLPNNINFLNEGAKSAWGNSEEIICKHTIAPVFFHSSHLSILKISKMQCEAHHWGL